MAYDKLSVPSGWDENPTRRSMAHDGAGCSRLLRCCGVQLPYRRTHIVVASAFVAAWQLTRSLRWVESVAGVWLLMVAWILGYRTASIVDSLASGLLLAGPAFLGSRISKSFGGGWKVLLTSEKEEQQ